MYNSELLRALDDIYERMPYSWQKWEPAVDNTEKDLVQLLEDSSHGHFPRIET